MNDAPLSVQSTGTSRRVVWYVIAALVLGLCFMAGIALGRKRNSEDASAPPAVFNLARGATIIGSSYCKTASVQEDVPGSCWKHLVDGEIKGEESAVVIRNGGVPFATVELPGEEAYEVDQITILSDVGIGEEERWLKDFHVSVSEEGETYTEVLKSVKTRASGFETFTVAQASRVRFVKIYFESNYGDRAWTQVGEVEIHGRPASGL